MLNAPRSHRWTTIVMVMGYATLTPVLSGFYSWPSSPETAPDTSGTVPSAPLVHLAQTPDGSSGQGGWGGPGGSQQTADLPPDLNWGEPGGSQLVADMADDLVNFYEWGKPGGSRDAFCSVTPYSRGLTTVHGTISVWSDRPLILWHNSNPRRVVVKDLDTILWNHPLASTETLVRYDGAPLQPGQWYDLIFTVDSSTETATFRTLSAEEREAVSAELAQLEDRAIANGANEEQLALWRSRFFIQHELHLLYDGLDALFSVENPSPELAQRQQELLAVLCPSNQEE